MSESFESATPFKKKRRMKNWHMIVIFAGILTVATLIIATVASASGANRQDRIESTYGVEIINKEYKSSIITVRDGGKLKNCTLPVEDEDFEKPLYCSDVNPISPVRNK